VALTCLGLVRLILCLSCSCPCASTQECSFTHKVISIQSNGVLVPVEVYEPDAPGRHPLVFMIHGSAGAFTRATKVMPAFDNFGELSLAKKCYVVALPHYMASAGVSSVQSVQQMHELFPGFLRSLSDALDQIFEMGSVDEHRVAVYGESLGGYLSIALASKDSPVTVVSEFSGGLPVGFLSDRAKLKSLLIQHGREDTLVDVSNVLVLRSYARRHHAKVVSKIYSDQGHYFDQITRDEVLRRTVEFLHERLK